MDRYVDIRDLWDGNVSDGVARTQERMSRVALDRGIRKQLDNKDTDEKERQNRI